MSPRGASDRVRRAAALSGTALAGGALVGLGGPVAAGATAFEVTNTADSGDGSLRNAVELSNSLPGEDTITFASDVTGTIDLTSGQLAISDPVDIVGPGPDVLTVDANDTSRVFYVYSGSAVVDVTISGLTITGGHTAGTGGGVAVLGEALTLDDVILTGNSVEGVGGGVFVTGGGLEAPYGSTAAALTVVDSVIADNYASSTGGGIEVSLFAGVLDIADSTISGNESYLGAGINIYYSYDPGEITIERTTISNNTGDGIGFLWEVSSVLVENSTISGNTGYGISLGRYTTARDLTVTHSTIVDNGARGIDNYGNPAPFLDHVIVADNVAPDLYGAFEPSFSLIEDPGEATITDGGGNIFGVDPQLGPLADNGGQTLTHLPQATSPAVDAGDPQFTPPPAVDQRGLPRVVDIIDIGSVERQPFPAPDCATATPTIVGTHEDDVLLGTPGRDVIFGRGGDDTIVAGGGDDLVCGGAGLDIITGRHGADQLFGERGADDLAGGKGVDLCRGGPGSDTFAGSCETTEAAKPPATD